MRHFFRNRVAAYYVILAVAVSADASFSNVEISEFEQLGLDLTFQVSWDTAENPSSGADLVDIWLQTRQPDPSSFVQTALEQVHTSPSSATTAHSSRHAYAYIQGKCFSGVSRCGWLRVQFK